MTTPASDPRSARLGQALRAWENRAILDVRVLVAFDSPQNPLLA
jgi:hypothetical protein